MFSFFSRWLRRWKYRPGRTLTKSIARDVRRDVRIVSADRIASGFITCKSIGTSNVLSVSSGLVGEVELESPQKIHIDNLWDWTGQTWGGLSDGTSLASRLRKKSASSRAVYD